MHQHNVEAPHEIQLEQILPDRLDWQRPLLGEPATQFQRRLAKIEHHNVQDVLGPRAGNQRKNAGILRTSDENIA